MPLVYSDPLFWQALGKALGWNAKKKNLGKCVHCADELWRYHWHRFIDHLTEGKDVDTFFEELIK